MTTAVKEKKPFLPQRRVAAPPAGGAVALRGAPAGRPVATAAPLTIGGEPRVHLLPVDVVARKSFKALKRRLLLAGAAVLVVVLAGYGLATVTLTTAQSQLAAAQATTSQLVAQQTQYSSVTRVNSDIASIQSSQKESTTQEILWAPYLLSIENYLPADAVISAASATIDAPFGGTAPVTSSTGPLQGPRIATISLTVLMSQAEIPGWLNTLPKLKGFVDATPNSVLAGGNSGPYTVTVTIHVNSDAVSNRFAKIAGDSK